MYKEPYSNNMSEIEIKQILDGMAKDETLDTQNSYPKGFSPIKRNMSFSQRHYTYLQEHSKMNAGAYLANLRTMLKIR